ncbi:hypothetical protein CPHO_02660 [Corynebacterium phocae]|uniref:Xylose isomerase-like TIM barrel domain-containing protein n=1 Tax=Corynebacterium phocae TaxID=161895 RepID=A0A1L7D675_9CORY|nr:L-ribulose-5-phosphate 3-epimerase [Corynebacterium phocae]APT93620.1 hypothetical protein CPHO_02660 [Corynebacterium phocae]KAA8726979.1 L-ribulose-5-phosphate 3-epimerase [Corynebacterium phocae]
MDCQISLGIYEKALRSTDNWDDFFAQVNEGGFSFVDLSVDETDERRARLEWSAERRQEVRAAAMRNGVQIGGICLSLHRLVMPGSIDPAIRAEAREVYRKGIDLCADLGISLCQIAGYYNYYEDPHDLARKHYIDLLAEATQYAAHRGIVLGIENVDGNDINSIPAARELVDMIGSPWLQIYPDLGNISEHGGEETAELRAGEGHMMAIHAKDVLPGQPRRIPLGTGTVDWPAAFAELARQKWSGRMMLEMWNDDAPDSVETCVAARLKLTQWLEEAGFTVLNEA